MDPDNYSIRCVKVKIEEQKYHSKNCMYNYSDSEIFLKMEKNKFCYKKFEKNSLDKKIRKHNHTPDTNVGEKWGKIKSITRGKKIHVKPWSRPPFEIGRKISKMLSKLNFPKIEYSLRTCPVEIPSSSPVDGSVCIFDIISLNQRACTRMILGFPSS